MNVFEGLGDRAELRAAASAYADVFERERDDLTAPPGPRDPDEVRVVLGEASLIGYELPVDAALHASVEAATGRVSTESDRSADRVWTLLIRSIGGR